MSENTPETKIEKKAEIVLQNLPNPKNIKKHLPKILKDTVGFDKIVKVVKDSKGKTVQVDAIGSHNNPNTFYAGYNEKDEVVAVLKQGTDCEKKPFTFVQSDDPKGKHHFIVGRYGYDLTIKHNNSFDQGVIAKYSEEPAVIIGNNPDSHKTATVKVRDLKGRLILSQTEKGDYTTYTYLRNTTAVTDYSQTVYDIRLNKEANSVKEFCATQTVVHYEYKSTDPYYCSNIIPKYACETENGVLIKEYFIEEDSIGGFVHVIDYKNNEEYWKERDYQFKYPEQGNAHPSHLYSMGGNRFNSREEYEAYRNNKVDEMKVKEKAHEMLMAHGPRHFGPMMCGPWF